MRDSDLSTPEPSEVYAWTYEADRLMSMHYDGYSIVFLDTSIYDCP